MGPKDLYGWQANASPDRLTKPLIRENGKLVETDWDTAMDRVLAQAAQGIKHTDLLAVAQRCHPETVRQMHWANAKLKESSTQMLIS
ncbi:hypothetical protein E4J89_13085 [Arthrobacter sp. CAU 1506]|uniref:molybdopterin-dependent oxidoreductase n=1 Tax=Arthrobacter sp. CAU 1506 TaxID=2560052 RepID=UPI0010AC94C0|nr:molybdopterin-dependent oxidoreductase [Arthrobacter sp. CAU 1506]TJY68814.1 hypothetical protein E4J89_13085 [Arthrobacter sp. CAU 1506]